VCCTISIYLEERETTKIGNKSALNLAVTSVYRRMDEKYWKAYSGIAECILPFVRIVSLFRCASVCPHMEAEETGCIGGVGTLVSSGFRHAVI
jgi:hypothetical protein